MYLRLVDVWARALKGVTLNAGRGVLVVLGRNGSGKTTLLRVAAGLIKPERGRVEAPPRVGSSWQNPYYSFHRATVIEEAAATLGGRSEATRLLREYGLDHLAGRSPFTLSMGQARLLSILLAHSWGPDMLVLDEPTSGLGHWERGLVSRLIRGMDGIVLVATHDVDFALEVGDRVVVLDDGRIVMESSIPEAFYSGELYKLGFPTPLAVEVGARLGRVLRSVYSCKG